VAASRAEEILLPAKAGFILLSLVCALFLNLLPIYDPFWPDFVALVLLYWCVKQPHKVGFLSAFVLGLIMDVANGSLFGEHTLAYSALAYLGLLLSRRVPRFGLGAQTLHVLPVLLVPRLISLIVQVAAGAPAPGWEFLAPTLVAALLWPIVSTLLQLPQRPKPATVEEV
jgi:rod shape-determining protein MreD